MSRLVQFVFIVIAACGGLVTESASTLDAGPTTDGGALDALAPLPVDYKIVFGSPQNQTLAMWRSKTGETTDLGIPFSNIWPGPVCTYDGRYIVVSSRHDGAASIDVYDATGALVRTHGAPDGPFAIRPDGMAILVRTNTPCFIQLLADGSSSTTACFDPSQDSLTPTSYSPDGARILWHHGTEVPSATSDWGGQVVSSTIDGAARQTIVPMPTLDDAGSWIDDTLFNSPSFSFDGSEVVGSSTTWGAYLDVPGNLRVVNVNTSTVTNVFPKSDRLVDLPHFTPDGKALVFVEVEEQNMLWSAIRLVDLATLNERTIATNPVPFRALSLCVARDLD